VRVLPEAPVTRDALMAALNERGIGVGVHFRAVHLHPYYREELGFAPGLCPVAEQAGEQLVSLPLFPDMHDADIDRVTVAVREILGG
jgi:dTDP-4-amino-4,6-dideoxygalactose transaminase